uniref:ATP-dependent RNA helicase n=1 Tax=Saccoglossus kowalevskii TaxID=10224 RepID=A0ABM0MHT2_SACKO|nr:PREDICTED: ATP-dependent RNA helicase DDX24-like [Saccoglossus kowalevskii]
MATSTSKHGKLGNRFKKRKRGGMKDIMSNANWKTVDLGDMDLSQIDEAGEIVCFEELTDYTVLTTSGSKKQKIAKSPKKSEEKDKDTVKNTKTGGKKRKLKDDDDEPLKKKKKKTKKQIKKAKDVDQENKDNPKLNDIEEEEKTTDDETEDEEEWKKIDMSSWLNLLIPEPILHALADQKFTCPTPIQQQSLIPAIRDYKDIIGAAETGSGKTLAFGIPILHHILNIQEKEKRRKVKDLETGEDHQHQGCNDLLALVLTPTRELAIQVRNHLVKVAKYTGIHIAVVVGGMSKQKQERILKKKPQVVIATPGRLWELVQQGDTYLNSVSDVRYLVIDEADRMVERGHFAELTSIIDLINGSKKTHKRQTFVFSATLTMVHLGPKRKLMKGKFDMNKTQKLDDDMPVFPVELKYLAAVKERVKLTRKIDKMDHKFQKLKHQNDWFTRNAEELDIELDEDCLHDLGDSAEQKDHRKHLKSLRSNLNSMLKTTLFPKGFSAQYPTRGGQFTMPYKQVSSAVGKSATDAVDAVKQGTHGMKKTPLVRFPKGSKQKNKHKRKKKNK